MRSRAIIALAGVMGALLLGAAVPRVVRFAQTVQRASLNAQLHSACTLGDAAEVEALVRRGADLENRDSPHGRLTPLMMAALDNQDDVIRTLARLGADLEARDERGCTALMQAAQVGAPQAAEALLQLGVAVDAKDFSGRTAWVIAHAFGPSNGHDAVRKLLRRRVAPGHSGLR